MEKFIDSGWEITKLPSGGYKWEWTDKEDLCQVYTKLFVSVPPGDPRNIYHRLDGPAFITKDLKQYYIDGKKVSVVEFLALTKKFTNNQDINTTVDLGKI